MIVKGSTSSSGKKDSKRQKKLAAKMDDRCPLCTDIFDPDDVNFFPCQCGYQICLFCWHRIRTNENCLCPHCRRHYAEDPANFKPLSPEELAKRKNEKKKKEIQKKKEVAESRKLLANIRVVQKNLVFVHGLPVGIDTPDEKYRRLLQIFKEFGPVSKCVVNNKTNYAGSQIPRASVYVTYLKIEDALRAYKSLPSRIEEYEVKTSLGTTKYCSNFLKNVHCPKQDCMYLHENADEELCFTKEQIHAGEHLAFGDHLYDKMMSHLQSKLSQSKDAVISEQEVEEVQPKLNSEPVKDSLNGHSSDSSHSPGQNNTSPLQSRLQSLFTRESQNHVQDSEETRTPLRCSVGYFDYIEKILNKQKNGETSVEQSLSEEDSGSISHRTVNDSKVLIFPPREFFERPSQDSTWSSEITSNIGQSNSVHEPPITNHIPNDCSILNGVDSASQVLNGLSLNDQRESGTSNSTPSKSASFKEELGFDPVEIALEGVADMVKDQPPHERETHTLQALWSQRSFVPSPSNATPVKLYENQKRKNPPPGFPVNNMQTNQPPVTSSPSYDSSNVLIRRMDPENYARNSLRHTESMSRLKPEYNTYNPISSNVLIHRMSPENTYIPQRNVLINRMSPSPVQNVPNSFTPNPVRTKFQVPRFQQAGVSLNGNAMLNGYSTPPVRNFTPPQHNPHQAQVMQELIARSLNTSQHIQSQSQNVSHTQFARVDPNLSSPSYWNVNQSQPWVQAENSFQGQSMQDFGPGSPVNLRRLQPQFRPIQPVAARFTNPSPYPDNPQFMYPNAQHNQLSKEIVHSFP